MDLSVFREWRTVEVVKRPPEDGAFRFLEALSMRPYSLTPLDKEVLHLEHKCLRVKPHFSKSQAARATWIKEEYNRKHGYGLGAKQVYFILLKCTAVMERESILEQ